MFLLVPTTLWVFVFLCILPPSFLPSPTSLLPPPSVQFTSLQFTSLQFTSVQFTSVHFTSLHFSLLHIHITSLQFILLSVQDSKGVLPCISLGVFCLAGNVVLAHDRVQKGWCVVSPCVCSARIAFFILQRLFKG